MINKSITCSKNSRIRYADRVAVIDSNLFYNRPHLSVGKRYVDSKLRENLRGYLYPSVSRNFRLPEKKVLMERETWRQSILPLLVDCTKERPVRLKSCRCKSLIVTQTYAPKPYAVSGRDDLGKLERVTYQPDLRNSHNANEDKRNLQRY